MDAFEHDSFDKQVSQQDEFSFDPTSPAFMRTRSGCEIPDDDLCNFISGSRHPDLVRLQPLTRPLERGCLLLPSTIPLLSDDPAKPLRRQPVYGLDLVLQSEERAKHTFVFGPTGAGKNVHVIDLLRHSALKDPSHIVVTFSLKASDYGPIEATCAAHGKKMVVLNLNDAWRSVGWNPLDTTQADVARDHIVRFADTVRNPESRDSEFWTQWVMMGLQGAWEAGYKSFPEICQLYALPRSALINKLRELKNNHLSHLADFISSDSGNAATVSASIQGALSCFASENATRVMTRDELQLQQLLHEPVCLHVEMPETSLESQSVFYQMLARTITDQLILNAEAMGREAPPATIFYDDMPALGFLLTPSRLMTMRSRNIGVVAGIQSWSSLEYVYGRASQALVDNVHTKIILPGVPTRDAAYFATSTGEQMVALPAFEGSSTALVTRPLLSAAQIQTPTYTHPAFGPPATIIFGTTPFQAYLQRSYEHPSLSGIVSGTRHITGLERLRDERLPLADHSKTSTQSAASVDVRADTRGWTDGQIRERTEQVLHAIEIDQLDDPLAKVWSALVKENWYKPAVLLRLVEDVAARSCTISQYCYAYLHSGTEDYEGVLHYMQYQRLKLQEQAKRLKKRHEDDFSEFFEDFPPMMDPYASDGYGIVLDDHGQSIEQVIGVVMTHTIDLLEEEVEEMLTTLPIQLGCCNSFEVAQYIVKRLVEAGGKAHIM